MILARAGLRISNSKNGGLIINKNIDYSRDFLYQLIIFKNLSKV